MRGVAVSAFSERTEVKTVFSDFAMERLSFLPRSAGGVRPQPSRIREITAALEEGNRASLEDLWQLLSIDVEKESELAAEVIEASHRLKVRLFAEEVYCISPLYVTSCCQERCTYCNFRAPNRKSSVSRLRLTEEQLEKELDFLVRRQGLRVMELVYSSDPTIGVREMARHLQITRSALDRVDGTIIGINAGPLDEAGYRQLRAAGLDFVVLWQETYDRKCYRTLHPGRTPKSNFENRVNAYERMIRGGLRHIGMAVLSGLAPWREDWLSLLAHENYLLDTYATSAAILGIPRLKSAEGAPVKTTPYIPSDREFLLAIAVHNLFSPLTLPFVNTRESWPFCVEAARGGGAIFTLDCSTVPGGYSQGSRGYQFPTETFPAPEFLPKLRAERFTPVVAWDFDSIYPDSKSGPPPGALPTSGSGPQTTPPPMGAGRAL